MTHFDFFQSALKFRALKIFFQSELNFGTESTHRIFVLPSTLRVYQLTNNVNLILTQFKKKNTKSVIYLLWWHTSAPYMQDKLCQHAT